MRTQVEQATCDFCGYGGWLSRPDDFTTTGDVDLCRWCAGAPTGQGVMASGRHEVTIGADTWTCTCGEVYRYPIFTPREVLAALPSVVGATASVHVNRI